MIPASPSASPSVAYGGRPNILRRAEAWLDSKGRKAWIAAMVLGFVFFWPVGLFFVAYITATNRWSSDKMFGCAARKHRHHHGRYKSQNHNQQDDTPAALGRSRAACSQTPRGDATSWKQGSAVVGSFMRSTLSQSNAESNNIARQIPPPPPPQFAPIRTLHSFSFA